MLRTTRGCPMSPIRHEGDYRRKPIKSWDDWIEEEIVKSQEAGDFDNLPGFGKPIHIETNPHAPELDLAYSRLKNAGYMPAWMERDQEIQATTRQLQGFLERSVAWLQQQADRIRMPRSAGPVPAPPSRSWWKRLLHGPGEAQTRADEPATLDDLQVLRSRMRGQYLQRAADLDKLIAEFNNTLSRDLWHLERMRLTQERAARTFDNAMAAVDLEGHGATHQAD